MSDLESPVTSAEIFSALIAGEFKPFTKEDEMTYGGVEFTGFTWTPFWEGCSFKQGEVVVVLDHSPSGMLFQVMYTSGEDVFRCWSLELGGNLKQIH